MADTKQRALIEAFERHFQADSADPAMGGELAIWEAAWQAALASQAQPKAKQRREAVARAICLACEENPYNAGDARGHAHRWQDYLPCADAAITAGAAQAQVPEDVQRDAKRYRYLRENAPDRHMWSDASIDAAMAAEPATEGR